jgi:hypothetical protein
VAADVGLGIEPRPGDPGVPGDAGPLVKTLGGADISWIVGWFTAALLYLALTAATTGTGRRTQRLTAPVS